nr:HYR domain-containing protein [Saprospiraceae bacterium]
MNSNFPNTLIPQTKHPVTSVVIALLFFCCFQTNSTAQVVGERINLNMNANPTYNVSLQGLPPVGCGTSKTSFCVAQDNVCYIEQGLIDKVTFEDLQGVHMVDLSGPDTIRVKVTNSTGFLPSWPEADIDVLNGEDNFVRFVVTQNTSGVPEFEALIIIDPNELDRENESTPKLHRLQFTLVSSYFPTAAGSVSKNLEIEIPFMILGATTDLITPRGVTTTPKTPYLILHDPPGDGSSSKFLANRQTCRNFSTSVLLGGSARVWGSAKLGFETSGVVPVEVYAQYTVGLTAALEHRSQTETELCITTTQEFATSDLDQNTGTAGDIFIGVGRTLQYGVAESLVFDPNTCTTRLEKRLAFRATGEQAKFALTEQQIRQDIINQQSLADNPAQDPLLRSRARSQVKTWNQVLQLNEQNKQQAINGANGAVNTFAGQTSESVETEISTTTIQTIESTISISTDVALEVGAEVQGTGVSGGAEIEIRSEFGESVTNSVSSSKVIGYTLTDDDPNDLFSYRVGTDPMFGTPVFSLVENSTRSSCPYEGGIKIDQPKLTASSLCATGKNILVENVPVGSSANLNLNICNDSDFERTYWLALDGSSNNRGAKFTFAGTELNATDKGVAYTVGPRSCFNTSALLVISQNPNAPNELIYDNMVVYLYPECEGTSLGELAIVDQINLSVRFSTTPNAIPRATVDGVPEDVIPPTLAACPQSQTIDNFPGACGERVQFALPTATDNCGTATVTQIEGPASNDNFFPGTTTVSFLATDQSGNTATCSFTVTVNDNETPSVTFCPPNQTV